MCQSLDGGCLLAELAIGRFSSRNGNSNCSNTSNSSSSNSLLLHRKLIKVQHIGLISLLVCLPLRLSPSDATGFSLLKLIKIELLLVAFSLFNNMIKLDSRLVQ